jgi:hypothetical protein
MAIIGTNCKVEVEAVVDSPDLVITAVTKANPGKATASALHGLQNGDVVRMHVISGMVELNGQACRVSGIAGSDFNLEGIDTTNFSTWDSGHAEHISTFQTLSSAQNVTMPNPAPAKIDITTLIDKSKQYAYGLPDAPDGSITGLFNPGGAAEQLIFAATAENTALVFRITFAAGQKTIFNANVSGGSGFDLATNAAATATVSFTPVKQVCHYGS